MPAFFRKHSVKLALSGLFLSILACGTTPAAAPTATPTLLPTSTALPTATSVPLIQSVTLGSVPQNETSQKPAFTISALIPVLQGSSDPRAVKFNGEMTQLTQEEIAKFKDNARVGVVIPGGGGSSYDQKFSVYGPLGNLIGIKFDILIYIAGAAHPNTHSRTVTYDLEAGQDISLDQLFLANSNYLDLIANYCIAQLKQMNIGFDPSIFTGAQAVPENYTNWNLTPDGLLITFDAYQVAAYAAGPQQITVPYSELKPAIDPNGPLGPYSH